LSERTFSRLLIETVSIVSRMGKMCCEKSWVKIESTEGDQVEGEEGSERESRNSLPWNE